MSLFCRCFPLTFPLFHPTIEFMSTINKPMTQEDADHRHMLDHAFRGKPLDPEVSKHVEERAERVRADMRSRGVKVDAVELLRECREEL